MALVTDADDLTDLVSYYRRQPAFVFDVETLGEDRDDPHVAPVAWISLATENSVDVIPMDHPHGELEWEGPALLKSGRRKVAEGKSREQLRESDFSRTQVERRWGPAPNQLPRGQVFETLRPLFFDEGITKVAHYIKFDLHAVAKYLGEHPSPPYYDTLLASWILDVGLRKRGMLGLDDCVKKELGITMVKGVGKKIEDHAFSVVAKYSHDDAALDWRLYQALLAKHAASPQTRRLLDLEHAVLSPVLEMEATGVRMDTAVLTDLDREIRLDIEGLQGGVWNLAGHRFNLRSNRDKQQVLFGEQKLKPLRVVPSASGVPEDELTIYDYAVDQETLERHARTDPMVRMLLAHGAKTKLHGTYILPYLGGTQDTVDEKGNVTAGKVVRSRLRDGRIHCQFVQNGTESGRLSSRGPNLQNVPSRTAEGRKIRSAFLPDPGHVLVQADYSQIEPRIIASLSDDPTMLATYRDGGDVYLAVAKRMGVSRTAGKTLVLAIAYGVGATKISADIGCSIAEARDLMEYFARQFPRIGQHKAKVISRARMTKYSETVWGRRRYLPKIASRDEGERAMAKRQAYNHHIQGTAADIMKVALVNIQHARPDDARMLLTVHDEVVLTAPLDTADAVAEIVKREMEAARPTRITVPLVADVKIINNWGEAKT